MKPESLDLEWLKKYAPNDVAKADVDMIVRALYRDEKEVDTKEEAIEIVSNLIEEIVDEAKRQIKRKVQQLLKEIDKEEENIPEFSDSILKFLDSKKGKIVSYVKWNVFDIFKERIKDLIKKAFGEIE